MGTRQRATPTVTGALAYAEVALPGALIGVAAGAFGAGTAALAGLPLPLILTITAGLGVPLALAGGCYCVLLALGRLRIGAVAPAALYWAVAFPAARLVEEAAMAWYLGQATLLREPLWSFLLFQAMLSVGYAIGFLWLHERLAPRWLLATSGHNPVAGDLAGRYLRHLEVISRRRTPAATGRRGNG
ncbi:hypothetical protein SAMN02745673_00006 [Marinactinospora thermotolerans DSM 45154]|uniref:Uncharacterized protein n=1 Tax=Marinactinospora thermotolerans DSM 45154 TaxID=1122192 RepID=A0A1T4JW34_9ACTN|nr:hypothetical protein [Marinactinospora thermotolerans]SJZ34344.1 hypothetical protein SAMN02745673_00006 [Marinactinospora thermotolerans DSM 45154]